MNTSMERAYSILNSFSDEELQGFLLMFGNRKAEQSARNDTKAERIARKKAAFERILASRKPIAPDFDEKKALLDYLDERYGS